MPEALDRTAGHALEGLPRQGWRRSRGAVAVFSWLYLGVVLGSWALLWAADLWWPATLLMFGPRWVLVLPAGLLVPAALVLRRRSLWLLLLALVLAMGPVAGFRIPWQRLLGSAPRGARVRILTCNAHYRKLDARLLGTLLDQSQPDVITLQEYPGSSEFLGGGKWHLHRMPGIFLASRYPIRQASVVGTDSMSNRGLVLRYELATPAGA